jgi:hypothetical protein
MEVGSRESTVSFLVPLLSTYHQKMNYALYIAMVALRLRRRHDQQRYKGS